MDAVNYSNRQDDSNVVDIKQNQRDAFVAAATKAADDKARTSIGHLKLKWLGYLAGDRKALGAAAVMIAMAILNAMSQETGTTIISAQAIAQFCGDLSVSRVWEVIAKMCERGWLGCDAEDQYSNIYWMKWPQTLMDRIDDKRMVDREERNVTRKRRMARFRSRPPARSH